jgi:hypothetical protein
MTQVSRPMQIALGATLLLLAVWFVALRPKPSSSPEAAAPAPVPAQTTPAPVAPVVPEPTRAAARPARAKAGEGDVASRRPIHTRGPVASVRAALKLHKAIAIAFVDSATADSQAVERELLHVSHFGGRAFTIAAHLADLSDYGFITKTVEVTVAPTVVIVDPRHRASTIVGFADRGEIEQRLADALAVKRG